MKIKNILAIIISLPLLAGVCSCSNTKSYAEMLRDEQRAVNRYLAQYRVVNEIPADSVFEVGPNAPFYKMEPDGNVYMQVLNPGDKSEGQYEISDQVYFRYMTMSLQDWELCTTQSEANLLWTGTLDNADYAANYFLYQDYNFEQSASWGYGLQMPLMYLGKECEVNIVIKSQYGQTENMAYVIPYIWHVKYFKPMI